MGKQYRSSKGRLVDMEALRSKNETSTAVGNMGVNTRGDKLGRGGKVVETADKIARAYHQQNPKAVKTVSIKADEETEKKGKQDLDIEENMPAKKSAKKKTIDKKNEVELEDGSIKIVKDNDSEES